MRNNFDRMVSRLNVTRSQWAMIAVVSRQPGLTQRQIADHLEMSEASAGRLIDRLCAEGLLERRAREDDRRARAVFLSGSAQPLLEKITEVARDGEARVFRDFSEEELQQLRGYLDRIYENLARG